MREPALLIRATLVVALFNSAAEARPNANLEYSRGSGAEEECPDRAAFRAAVAERLGYDPFDPETSKEPTIDVALTAGDRAFDATIRYKDATGQTRGERTLHTTDCAALTRSAAFTVSVMLEQTPTLAPEPAEAAPEPAVAPPVRRDEAAWRLDVLSSTEEPRERDRSAARENTPTTWAARFGLGGYTAFGAGPSAAPGIAARLGVRQRSWLADLEGRMDFPSETSDENGFTARASLLTLALLPCYAPGSLRLCFVMAAGAIDGEASGPLVTSRPKRAFYAAGGVRLGWEPRISSALSLLTYAELLAPVTRTRLFVDDTEVWSQPRWSAILGAGAVGAFP